MQRLQRIWIDGQVVERVGDGGGGGVITAEDEKDGLGENLPLSQTCKTTSRTSPQSFFWAVGMVHVQIPDIQEVKKWFFRRSAHLSGADLHDSLSATVESRSGSSREGNLR